MGGGNGVTGLWFFGGLMMDIEAISRGEIKDLQRANLIGVDLRGAALRGANLLKADLRKASLWRADLKKADLRKADLRKADLQEADLQEADLWRADLRRANLRGADLVGVDLRESDLRGADLRGADIRGADFSGAQLPTILDWLTTNLEQNSAGWIVYKRIEKTTYTTPFYWTIKPGAVLNENCDGSRVLVCSYGVNFGTLKWCENNYKDSQLWKCLIRWKWTAGICVPYNTDGKARCERLELIEKMIDTVD